MWRVEPRGIEYHGDLSSHGNDDGYDRANRHDHNAIR